MNEVDIIEAMRSAQREWDADIYPCVGKILTAMSVSGRLKGYRPDNDASHAVLARTDGSRS